jgi:hypothetical protein
MKQKNQIKRFTIFSLLILSIVVGIAEYSLNPDYNNQRDITNPQNSLKMDIEFINQTLENILFDFYQEDNIVFKGNICNNVTLNIMDSINVEVSDNFFENTTGVTLTLWNCTNLIVQI